MMGTLPLPEDLISDITNHAREKNISVEEYLRALMQHDAAADPPPMPEWKRELRRKLYKMARDYWREAGDETRLALTDDELDVQFWLIDHEGIPRLIEDQGKVDLPPDPMEGLIGIINDGPETNIAEELDQIRDEYFRRKYGD
jgi:hypothetical protein